MRDVFNSVIFDLDGTLVDSAPDILDSLDRARTRLGLERPADWGRRRIGPPIAGMIAGAWPSLDPDAIRRVALAFREEYTTCDLANTRPFPGIPEVLEHAVRCGIPLFLATNKPLVSTRQVLNHLGWEQVFRDVATVDSQPGVRQDKAAMVARLCAAWDLDPDGGCMVGDSPQDIAAGKSNGLATCAAAWGYTDVDALVAAGPDRLAAAPRDLLRFLG
jgi:phosphoglycolate phosphatase